MARNDDSGRRRPPRAVTALGELTGQVQLARLSPLQLARGGFWDGAGAKHDDIRRGKPELFADPRHDRRAQALRVSAARFGYNHQLLGRGPRSGEDDGAPLANASNFLDLPLDLLWVVISSVDDENVLEASGHEQLAVDQIAEVPGSKPSAFNHPRAATRLRIPEVSGRHRRSAQPNLSYLAVRQAVAGFVEDSQLVFRKRPAARDDLPRLCAICGGNRPSLRMILARVDSVGPHRFLQTHEADRKRGLRHPVAGKHCLRGQTGGREGRQKIPERLRVDRLRSAPEHSHAGQIPSPDLLGPCSFGDQRIGKVWRKGHRSRWMVSSQRVAFFTKLSGGMKVAETPAEALTRTIPIRPMSW